MKDAKFGSLESLYATLLETELEEEKVPSQPLPGVTFSVPEWGVIITTMPGVPPVEEKPSWATLGLSATSAEEKLEVVEKVKKLNA